MLRRRVENFGRGRRLWLAALAAVAAAGAMTNLGCSTCTVNCPTPATHAMAFGATDVGCPDNCKCVCPVPEDIDVAQGDQILFVNTSKYEVTITMPAGSAYPGDVVIVPAGGEVLVSVKGNAPEGDFDLNVTVAAPGMACPGTGHPGIVIRPPVQSSS